MAGFFFTGEETAALSPDTVARKRRLLEALQQEATSTAPVQHWSQGAARLVNALANNIEERRLNDTETAGNKRVADFLASQLGAGASPAVAPAAAGGVASPPAAAPVSRGTAEPAASLISSESGGNWQAQNNAMGAGGKPGHFGRLQFGQARLQDAMNAGAIPAGTTPQQFMANPDLQRAAEAWHFADIDKAIQSGPAAAMIGKTINGVPVTQEGLRAVAHLGGTGGMNKFIQSGGQYNPADANGTTLLAYLQRHGAGGAAPAAGGAPAPAQAPQAPAAAPGINPRLAAALADPWLSKNPIIQQMLAAQLGRNPVDDALKRVQLAQAQRDLTDSKPFTIKIDGEEVSVTRDAQGNLRRVQLAGETGPTQPKTYRTADGRDVQLPSDPAARKKFLEEMGQSSAKAVQGAPDAVQTASISLNVIDQLIGNGKDKGEHPGLKNLFGPYGKLPTMPGGSTADAEALLAQIKDRSFLAGIESMRGTGAITEAEGAKATGAIARLSTNQSPKAFKESLNELRGILQTARQRNQTIAAGGKPPAAAAPAPASGGWNEVAPGVRIREM